MYPMQFVCTRVRRDTHKVHSFIVRTRHALLNVAVTLLKNDIGRTGERMPVGKFALVEPCSVAAQLTLQHW